ncbi:hypothetical protein ACOME3_003909 [Neoechinorhynchus agilis]
MSQMSSSVKIPTVLWSQTKSEIVLVIDVHDLKDTKISVEKRNFKFYGSDDSGAYAFDIPLAGEVVPVGYESIQGDRNWIVKIKKAEVKTEGDKNVSSELWKSLNEGKKLPFVKVDWSRWTGDGSDSDDDFMPTKNFELPQAWNNDADLDDLDPDSDDESSCASGDHGKGDGAEDKPKVVNDGDKVDEKSEEIETKDVA